MPLMRIGLRLQQQEMDATAPRVLSTPREIEADALLRSHHEFRPTHGPRTLLSRLIITTLLTPLKMIDPLNQMSYSHASVEDETKPLRKINTCFF